ncbi:MAG: 50S ribosomal protein L11 methyltransferase [Solirubrobacterales bacterium]
MLELTLRVGAADVEEVLDAVLPALPGGVHLQSEEGEVAELSVTLLPGTPGEEEVRRLAGPLLIDLSAAEVSDDWRERRLARYEPLVAAERFELRPEWAPPSGDPALVEIVLGESAAFGTGSHPTTQACLAALAEAVPSGRSLADYGCGSGVLAIAAAKLGFSPVIAVDVEETSVGAARENAERNEVEVDVRQLDLLAGPPPAADVVAVNVPPAIQIDLAGGVEQAPGLVIASGFTADDVADVASAWEARGLRVAEEQRVMEWSMLVLR